MPKRVIARRNLPKFGDAVEGEQNVTLKSPDVIIMEHPDDQLVEDADEQATNTLAGFILKQQERALEREHDLGEFGDIDELMLDENGEIIPPVSNDGPSSSAGGGSSYVPPSARGGAGGPPRGGGLDNAFAGKSAPGGGDNRDAENTLRVSNLTKSVTEDDLRELFCRYGRIARVSLPKMEKKDERGNIYKEPKGFAYIAFAMRADAQVAMDALQGHGYDHLILKIEWAKAPDANKEPSAGFRSGYGEKLAQDTKEKVSFQSNLTENR
mgnify:CR=1 FL=1